VHPHTKFQQNGIIRGWVILIYCQSECRALSSWSDDFSVWRDHRVTSSLAACLVSRSSLGRPSLKPHTGTPAIFTSHRRYMRLTSRYDVPCNMHSAHLHSHLKLANDINQNETLLYVSLNVSPHCTHCAPAVKT